MLINSPPNLDGCCCTLTGTAPGMLVRAFDALGCEALTATTDAASRAALALPLRQSGGVYAVRVGPVALRLTRG